jgi:DNA uptake protein ComE-like DNA-binding protein
MSGTPGSGQPRSRTHLGHVAHRIDVNAASGSELAEVLEIDGAVADRIIERRAREGGFRSVDDLARIPGVDEVVLRRMRERLIVELPVNAEGASAR